MDINWISLDQHLRQWLVEDIGRGDQTTLGLELGNTRGQGTWIAKEEGIICGLPVAERIFKLLIDSLICAPQPLVFMTRIAEGTRVKAGTTIVEIQGPLSVLLTGERIALNLAMRLSGIATKTRRYVNEIEDLPTQLVDTRKTIPGLRNLEKYATRTGGACNHRLGLDDSVMIKDNHIAAAGGIAQAIGKIRSNVPYPLSIEVETESLEQVQTALSHGADIIMLDNMTLPMMKEAVSLIRSQSDRVKIEGSGNVKLDTIRGMALTGVDYISSSAPITRAPWLDLSMRLQH